MWNKIKAALKAVKAAVVKTARYIFGGAAVAAGAVFASTGITALYTVAVVSRVISRTVNMVRRVLDVVVDSVAFLYCGAAATVAIVFVLILIIGAFITSVGNNLLGLDPNRPFETANYIFKDVSRFAGADDRVSLTLRSGAKSKEVVEDKKEEEISEPKMVPVPDDMNPHVHAVGVVEHRDGSMYVLEEALEPKEKVEASFFQNLRKKLAANRISFQETDFKPSIGATGYLDRKDAKNLDAWSFGHDEHGREFVTTPWLRETTKVLGEEKVRYGRVIIFQRYPSEQVVVQGPLQGHDVYLNLPYGGEELFLNGVGTEVEWGRNVKVSFANDVPANLDSQGFPI